MALLKPPSCQGCPLETLGEGFMVPQYGSNGVLLLGEALGEDEANHGKPFVGRAGFKLTRLIEWAGLDRGKFSIANSVWCRPPGNKLQGTSYQQGAIEHCKEVHWRRFLSHPVVIPLGNVPTEALLGKGPGILDRRGYIYPIGGTTSYAIPTVHPSYIARGNAKWSAAFIADLQKGVRLAEAGPVFEPTNYLLDPSPAGALQWATEYRGQLHRDPSTYLAFDIETPGKPEDEDEAEAGYEDLPDQTWHIDRIGFSFAPHAALSIPWEPPFFAAIRTLLSTEGPKVVWNKGFDVPRVRRMGFGINGIIHDGMIAWHVLHSDLPKKLAFVATFTCPWQPAWKHLSGSKPAFYNATDADVELRSMIAIEKELRSTGLWEVYQRDVVCLEPILVHMHDKGMPIDQEIRYDRAVKLQEAFRRTKDQLGECIPEGARRAQG